MSHVRWLAPVVTLVLSACHVYSSTQAGSGQLTAAEHLATSAPAAAQAERLSRCPSVVTGATTIVSETPGGVELRITGNAEAMPEIRRRAAYLATASEETAGKHNGGGSLNARFGRCPVVMRNTKVEVREIPGGAAVAMKPSQPQELDWLRREVESRTAQIATPKQFGAGLMKSCPSAVPNSKTIVTNTPYGVDVKIVETSPAGTRAIRQRAKELSAAGEPRDERCPVSAPDATMSVSEVTGGVVIAIKPKRTEDIALLRHTVQERARVFEPGLLSAEH